MAALDGDKVSQYLIGYGLQVPQIIVNRCRRIRAYIGCREP